MKRCRHPIYDTEILYKHGYPFQVLWCSRCGALGRCKPLSSGKYRTTWRSPSGLIISKTSNEGRA